MQSDLTDFRTGESPSEDELKDGPRFIEGALDLLAPDAEPFIEESCPWCCCPRISDGSCDHCEAEIPEDADWYQRGEKIVI